MLVRMSACIGLGWCILLGIRTSECHGLGGKMRDLWSGKKQGVWARVFLIFRLKPRKTQ